jgi:hypothetical protein
VLIIIEGVDGVGKTTLANKLRDQLLTEYGGDVTMRKCGPLRRDPLEEYVLDIEPYHASMEQHIIYDRHYVGELVYGPIYRGASRIDAAMRRYIELVLQARGAVLVVMHPGEGWQTHDTSRRVPSFDVNGTEAALHDRARRAANMFLVATEERPSGASALHPWHLYDFADDDDAAAIINGAVGRTNIAMESTSRFSMIGNSTDFCTYLLLGDTRGPKQLSVDFTSCFVPYPNTSGYYLIRAIPEEFDGTYAVTNASEVNVGKLWNRLGRPETVALGSKPAAFANLAGVPHGRVPHPQYVRRFHHHKIEEYGEQIFQCAEKGSTWQPS